MSTKKRNTMNTLPTASIPKLYIGIDVHKKSWTFHYQTDLFDGKTITQPASELQLINWVEKFYPNHQVTCAYEAGFSGFKTARKLKEQNWNVLVVNAADIPIPNKQSVVKSDKIDCRNICRQLAAGHLRSITIPDEQREQYRSLFRGRNQLVKESRRLKCQIKGLLFYYGINTPDELERSKWSIAFLEWLKEMQFSHDTAKLSLDILIKRYLFNKKELLDTSKYLRSYTRKYYKKDYDLLMSVPGVGPLVAMAILAELGDLRKFNRFDDLASYVGLVPGIYQSGENTIVKGMSPRSKALVRILIIEASWQAVRFDPVLQEYFRSHFGKKPTKIIVKVAKKLLSRIHAVIKTETKYEIGVIK
jgi:transposase